MYMLQRTALDLDGAVLGVEGVVVQVHHAGQGRGEPHAVRHRAVAGQSHKLVALRHVVEEAEKRVAPRQRRQRESLLYCMEYMNSDREGIQKRAASARALRGKALARW